MERGGRGSHLRAQRRLEGERIELGAARHSVARAYTLTPVRGNGANSPLRVVPSFGCSISAQLGGAVNRIGIARRRSVPSQYPPYASLSVGASRRRYSAADLAATVPGHSRPERFAYIFALCVQFRR